MADLQTQINELLAKVPASQRPAAASLLAEYGPRFFAMAHEDVFQYLRRLMNGDLDVVSELDSLLFMRTSELCGVCCISRCKKPVDIGPARMGVVFIVHIIRCPFWVFLVGVPLQRLQERQQFVARPEAEGAAGWRVKRL